MARIPKKSQDDDLELQNFKKGNPAKIVQECRATQLYSEAFLAQLEDGLRRSKINNS